MLEIGTLPLFRAHGVVGCVSAVRWPLCCLSLCIFLFLASSLYLSLSHDLMKKAKASVTLRWPLSTSLTASLFFSFSIFLLLFPRFHVGLGQNGPVWDVLTCIVGRLELGLVRVWRTLLGPLENYMLMNSSLNLSCQISITEDLKLKIKIP